MMQQQQIIQRHIASLTLEQRNQFSQMPPRQKQMLQTMDPQQKAAFIEKLKKDAQMRQQMMMQRQQQMAQQQQAQQNIVSQGQPIQQNVVGATANSPQQMQQWTSVGQASQAQQFAPNI